MNKLMNEWPVAMAALSSSGKGMVSAGIILRSDNKLLMEDPYQHCRYHQLATQLLQ